MNRPPSPSEGRRQKGRQSAGTGRRGAVPQESVLRSLADNRIKDKLRKGHELLSDFEAAHLHKSQPHQSVLPGLVSPDGRPYHKGVFSATRAHKLSTEAKDWREDRQFLGDPPSAFNNQVRKRALAHIKEVQADLKEQGQVEFEQRVQVERDALIKELWGQDAERARRTKIGQAMMHKIEQLARQSVRRQLNLESDFINVRDLGFAQVINAETDQLRRELAERKGAVEHDRAALEALQQQSQARRARSRAGDSPDPSRPWSGTNDPAKEAKIQRALDAVGQRSPSRPGTASSGPRGSSKQSKTLSEINLQAALDSIQSNEQGGLDEAFEPATSSVAQRRPKTAGPSSAAAEAAGPRPGTGGRADKPRAWGDLTGSRRQLLQAGAEQHVAAADMWRQTSRSGADALLGVGVQAVRDRLEELAQDKDKDDDIHKRIEERRLRGVVGALEAMTSHAPGLTARAKDHVSRGLVAWAAQGVAASTDMAIRQKEVQLPEAGEIGMRPADMYIKTCRSLGCTPLSALVSQLEPHAEQLALSGSYLSEPTAKALSMVLPHLRALGTLHVTSCAAHDGALSWLMGAAVYCPITSLDFSQNHLSEVGTIALARLLENRDPEGHELPPHPFSTAARAPWTTHQAMTPNVTGRPADFLDPGPTPATPMRAMYESDRTAKLSGINPLGGAMPNTRNRFNPYETIRISVGQTAGSMVAGSRPTAGGMYEAARASAASMPADFWPSSPGGGPSASLAGTARGGWPAPPLSAAARVVGGLHLNVVPSASRRHSVATCISALAAEPAMASFEGIPEDGVTELPGYALRASTPALRQATLSQLEQDDFAKYREVKPLKMRLPETRLLVRTLISLDLSDNPGIGSRAAATLLGALRFCTRQVTKKDLRMPLTQLVMSNCGIGEPFCAVLAEFLEENTTLKALNLSRNVIRGPGVAPLVNVIPLNQTLTHLDLSYNGLGDAGVCSLVRTLSGIWAEDPVRMKVHFLGLAGTRMGTRATLAVATLLAGMAGTLSEFADGASGLPPAFPPSWTFEIDISDHDLSGVAPVVLARQLRKLADLPQHRDGGRVVSVLHNHVTTTCLNRQAKLPGEVARGEEELRELVGEPAKGKGSKKGKGKKKGKKGPKPRVVTVGEEFKLECSNDEHKDILKLLVEHELEATAKGKVAFWSLKLGIRTYRLLGNNFPVGGKKATFDIRDIKWDERLPERGALELAVLLGPDAADLVRLLHPAGVEASVGAHLARPMSARPKSTRDVGATDRPRSAYWLPGAAGAMAMEEMRASREAEVLGARLGTAWVQGGPRSKASLAGKSDGHSTFGASETVAVGAG